MSRSRSINDPWVTHERDINELLLHLTWHMKGYFYYFLMSEIFYAHLLKSNPSSLFNGIRLAKFAQEKLYFLTTTLNKTVNGTGIFPRSSSDPDSSIPANEILIFSTDDESYYLRYEVTNEPIDPTDLELMEKLISKLNDVYSRFPAISPKDLIELDLTSWA